MRTHIIDKHLLKSSFIDPEEILRIGEGRYSTEIMLMTGNIRKNFKTLQKVFEEVKRTGNDVGFERAKTRLVESCLAFAEFEELLIRLMKAMRKRNKVSLSSVPVLLIGEYLFYDKSEEDIIVERVYRKRFDLIF